MGGVNFSINSFVATLLVVAFSFIPLTAVAGTGTFGSYIGVDVGDGGGKVDRLVLDVETDGSMSPRDALASAGATLRSLVQLVEDLGDAPQGLELG